MGAGGDIELLNDSGWRTVSAWNLADPGAYRSFIQGSAAEFSVAKDQYVLPRSGWFSDRSVCYLAANRPVVVQDTGFANRHGITAGILPFNDEHELNEAARSLGSDYRRHTQAAAELAHEHFEAALVLGDVMREVGLL